MGKLNGLLTVVSNEVSFDSRKSDSVLWKRKKRSRKIDALHGFSTIFLGVSFSDSGNFDCFGGRHGKCGELRGQLLKVANVP